MVGHRFSGENLTFSIPSQNRAIQEIEQMLQKQITNLVLTLVLLFQCSLNPFVLAQEQDEQPPQIEHEIVPFGVAGDNQEFSTTVTDNATIQSVTIFYRIGLDGDFDSIEMNAGKGDFYTATLKPEATPGSVLSYYIVAIDEAGNRAQTGFSFDALERQLESKAVVDLEQPNVPTPSKRVNWIYVALGALAVGALAAAAGGGGSDGSDNASPCSAAGCTLTLNLPSPQ